jgi:hypothetical protein
MKISKILKPPKIQILFALHLCMCALQNCTPRVKKTNDLELKTNETKSNESIPLPTKILQIPIKIHPYFCWHRAAILSTYEIRNYKVEVFTTQSLPGIPAEFVNFYESTGLQKKKQKELKTNLCLRTKNNSIANLPMKKWSN